MAENEKVDLPPKQLRKATVNTERIKTVKDVRLLFKLFNIALTEEHIMFDELLEKGFLTITEDVTNIEKSEQ